MLRRWLLVVFVGFMPLVLLAQEGVQPAVEPRSELVIEDAWIRSLPPSQPHTAAYFTLINRGETALGVVGATAEVARTTEIHTTRMIDGLMRMERVEALAVAVGETVEFVPGGLHLMLFGLSYMPEPGDVIELCVILINAERICTDAQTYRSSPVSK